MKKFQLLRLSAFIFLLCVALVIIGFNFVQAQGKPEKPPGKDKGKPTPSAPLLDLNDYNIVTAQPDGEGHLHVWGYTGVTYEKIWTAEEVHHSSVAIGDLDGDGITREIVGPTSCRIQGKPGKGPKNTSYYKYFINVYKEDFDASEYEMGIWRSTYYDDLDNNIKETNHWKTDIAIANVDGDSLNEVVLVTANYIAIFKYDPAKIYAYTGETGAFQRIALLRPADSVGEASLVLNSVACGNIDDDDEDEILISANVPGTGVNQSYILAYEYDVANTVSGLNLIDFKFMDDARLGHESFRIADLDGDGINEFCSTAYVYDENGVYQSYVFIWEQTEGEWYSNRYSFWVDSETDWPWNHLDTAELISTSLGDEIVISLGHRGKLIRYECIRDGNGDFQLFLAGEIFVDPFFNIGNVNIADTDGILGNEIVIGGTRLEVYSGDLVWMWSRIEDDLEVWDTAIGGPIIQ